MSETQALDEMDTINEYMAISGLLTSQNNTRWIQINGNYAAMSGNIVWPVPERSQRVEEFKDPYNVLIEVGSLVAYNYSGEVRIGKVLSFKPATLYRNPITYILIQEQATGFVSQVSSSRNLVVIQ